MRRVTAVHLDGTTNTGFNGSVGPLQFIEGVIELADDEHDIYVGYCATNVQFKVEHEVDGPAQDPRQLKGRALDAALDEAGLSKDGKADEKRARLAEHVAAQVTPPSVIDFDIPGYVKGMHETVSVLADDRTDTEREADEQAAASRADD